MACGNSSIGIILTKSSSTCDVQEWLKEREFDETVLSKFKDEEINGEDFFTLDMWMLESLVQGLKKLKKFRVFWSEETGMVILNSLFGL